MSVVRGVTKTRLTIAIVICVYALSGTQALSQNRSKGESGALNAKQVITKALSLYSAKLSAHPTCKTVGIEIGDQTIGDYIAGLLGEQINDDGKNWVEASCDKKVDKQFWQCRVEFGRQAGEEEWIRGLNFLIKSGDGQVVERSITCTGAG